MNKAIYPGTFDPITNGHVDVVHRAARLFEQVTIAVSTNVHKKPMFDLEQRIKFIASTFSGLSNVTVASFSGLLVEFAKQEQANVIVRGLRTVSDFEYELQMANANYHLNNQIETVFLLPSHQASTFISSSLVREIIQYGGDVSKLVPEAVINA